MIRQIVIAAVLGLGFSACGVGADETLGTQDQAVEQGTTATSQDPVPPKQKAYALGVDQAGNLVVITVALPASVNPGDTKGSSQDPVPPKLQSASTSSGRPPNIWAGR